MVRKEGLSEIDKWIKKEAKGLVFRWEEEKRKKDYDNIRTEADVFDISTLESLYRLSKKGRIKVFGGPISTGKEAVVFHALGEKEEELAVKIYRVSTSNFKAMQEYLIGDPRFKNIKKDRRSTIFTWAQKELKNLKRAFDAGVRVPEPIACDKNVLVMEFIGEDGVAAPRLKDIPLEAFDSNNIEELFHRIVTYMKILYNDARMVHADLSEFNILINFFSKEKTLTKRENDKEEFLNIFEPVIIDMGQATLLDHPNADDFLRRDVRNIAKFFKKSGLACLETDIMKMVKNDNSTGQNTSG
jgi:RIO kinase 1